MCVLLPYLSIWLCAPDSDSRLVSLADLVGICMGPINSYVADRWGRKVCLQCACTLTLDLWSVAHIRHFCLSDSLRRHHDARHRLGMLRWDFWRERLCSLRCFKGNYWVGCVLSCRLSHCSAKDLTLALLFAPAGLTAALMTSQIMLQEITHPADRGFLAALYDCNWVLGNVAASWCTFGTSFLDSSWAWVSLGQALSLPFLSGD